MKKRKNVQDATLKNIRVLKKKISMMDRCLGILVNLIYDPDGLVDRIQKLELASRSKKKR